MSKIETFDLISGANIPYDGICTLRPPVLDRVRKLGYKRYTEYMNILAVDLDTYLQKTGIKEQYSQLIGKYNVNYNIYDILIANSRTRLFLEKALSFFIVDELVFNSDYQCFELLSADDDKEVEDRFINRENYEIIISGILQLNYAPYKEELEKPVSYYNSVARELEEKISKNRALSIKESDTQITIPNMIQSVTTYHNSLNYENIWSLTVYQLYDQFFRLNSKIQFDVVKFRWAVWGKEDFDFKFWYRAPNMN